MKRPLWTAAASLALVVCATAQSGKIRRVDLERLPCYGTCPSYTLTLLADGTAYYNGGKHAPRQGMYKGRFNPYQLERLRALLDKWRFWSLKERYDAKVSDVASQKVTVVTAKGRKSVLEAGQTGPQELFVLQTFIDGLAANVAWKPHKLPPMP